MTSVDHNQTAHVWSGSALIAHVLKVISIGVSGMFVDINECTPYPSGEPVCGDNSKCANRMGTYLCPCCDGFRKTENGTCIGNILYRKVCFFLEVLDLKLFTNYY